jgi:hypothetical protein
MRCINSGGGTAWRFVKAAVDQEDQAQSFAPDAGSVFRRQPYPDLLPRDQSADLR